MATGGYQSPHAPSPRHTPSHQEDESQSGGERRRVPTGMRGWTKKDVGGQGGAASPQIEPEAPLEVSNPLDHPGLPGVGDGGGGVDVDDQRPPDHQHTCACFLVPACITVEQSKRRCCYGAYVCCAIILVILLMAVAATTTVWEVEGQQKTNISISTDETFEVSDVQNNNNLFSRKLCLLGPTRLPNPETLFLTRSNCSEVVVGSTTETFTRSNVSTRNSAQCNLSSNCCQSYGSLTDEIWQPTCIFVITKAEREDDVGYCVPISIKSFPRLELVWYSIGTLTALLLLAAVCTAGCGSVVYKSRHPYTDVACTCSCHLYQRQHYEPVPPD